MTEREERVLLATNWREMYLRAKEEAFCLKYAIKTAEQDTEDFRNRWYRYLKAIHEIENICLGNDAVFVRDIRQVIAEIPNTLYEREALKEFLFSKGLLL